MKILLVSVMVLSSGVAMAQHYQHKHGPSAYAGMETRPVKALSDQQLADLRAGRGMGMALAAELNGYPGPIHVLELAEQLGLSGDQRQRVQKLYDTMKADAVSIGEKLIEAEAALDGTFKDRSITPERITELSAAIGETQGVLRALHLKYHLRTAELLSPDQSRRYAELRGYR